MRRLLAWSKRNYGRLLQWYGRKRGFGKLIWLPFLMALAAGNTIVLALALAIIGPVGLALMAAKRAMSALQSGLRTRFERSGLFGKLVFGPCLLLSGALLITIAAADRLLSLVEVAEGVERLSR